MAGRPTVSLLVAAGLVLAVTGCGGDGPEAAPVLSQDVSEASADAADAGEGTGSGAGDGSEDGLAGVLRVDVAEADDDGRLPEQHTGSYRGYCAGGNVSPTISWSDAPEGTAGYAVTLLDGVQTRLVHWVVTGIPGDATGLAPAPDGQVTEGVVGSTLAGSAGYIGPCNPERFYLLTVYALDEVVEGSGNTSAATLSGLIEGHVLDQVEVTLLPADAA